MTSHAGTMTVRERFLAAMVLRHSVNPIGPVTPKMAENCHVLLDVWEETAGWRNVAAGGHPQARPAL